MTVAGRRKQDRSFMPTVCLYLQMHQPLRLRRYSVFETDANYFDAFHNAEILRRVASRCYQPVTAKLLDLVRRHQGRFRLSLSITGVLIEQLEEHAPQVLAQLRALAETGCVEFLAETYYHSLAFLYSRDEFREQTELHSRLMQSRFGIQPAVFRNTELIYNNDLAHYLQSFGRYKGVLAEGVDQILDDESPDLSYRPPHCEGFSVLLRNYGLSDDVAFRFSNRTWPEWPLTAEKFAAWIARINSHGKLANIFVDMETFGEHQWAETGILDFLDAMPRAVLAEKSCDFMTLSQAIDAYPPERDFDSPRMISWADSERDLSAWLGNAMQSNALHELYKLEVKVKARGDEAMLADWRRLTISDHFYYMCTKYFADGDVHRYFSPYESPYDSYINFMNVLDNLRTRVDR
jgi:alpha-amylase